MYSKQHNLNSITHHLSWPFLPWFQLPRQTLCRFPTHPCTSLRNIWNMMYSNPRVYILQCGNWSTFTLEIDTDPRPTSKDLEMQFFQNHSYFNYSKLKVGTICNSFPLTIDKKGLKHHHWKWKIYNFLNGSVATTQSIWWLLTKTRWHSSPWGFYVRWPISMPKDAHIYRGKTRW